jgi:hypothetical protein
MLIDGKIVLDGEYSIVICHPFPYPDFAAWTPGLKLGLQPK